MQEIVTVRGGSRRLLCGWQESLSLVISCHNALIYLKCLKQDLYGQAQLHDTELFEMFRKRMN